MAMLELSFETKLLLRDAVLALFWPRVTIVDFFNSNGCTPIDLGEAANWEEKQISRGRMVEIVFRNLGDRKDNGSAQLLSMLRSVVEFRHYDSYWFDVQMKLDINKAKGIQKKLEIIHSKLESKTWKQDQVKVRSAQNVKEIERIREKRQEIRNVFSQLHKGKNIDGKNITVQERGYAFEKLLLDLGRIEGLIVTEPFKIVGEQIDGAIKFDGEHYIVEAKWQASEIASDALYKFAYKVEGKLYGRGLIISFSGYTREAILAIVDGKAKKTILIDGEDILDVIEERISFSKLLDAKVRAAQTRGEIYIHWFEGKSKV